MGKILDMCTGNIRTFYLCINKNPNLHVSIYHSGLVHTIVECSVPAMPGDGGDMASISGAS